MQPSLMPTMQPSRMSVQLPGSLWWSTVRHLWGSSLIWSRTILSSSTSCSTTPATRTCPSSRTWPSCLRWARLLCLSVQAASRRGAVDLRFYTCALDADVCHWAWATEHGPTWAWGCCMGKENGGTHAQSIQGLPLWQHGQAWPSAFYNLVSIISLSFYLIFSVVYQTQPKYSQAKHNAHGTSDSPKQLVSHLVLFCTHP